VFGSPPGPLQRIARLRMPDFETECFFIAPIGGEGSPERERSDGVRDVIVAPAVAELGMSVVRADQIAQPGQITHQVIEHVLSARGAVADLTGRNANVYYELAVRHAAGRPVVLIAEEEERLRLPFDLSQMRIIFFQHTNLTSAGRAKTEIVEHLSGALDGAVDSPIATTVNLQALERGSSVEQTLAELVERVDRLGTSISEIAALAALSTRRPTPTHGHETSLHFPASTAFSDLARNLAGYTDPRDELARLAKAIVEAQVSTAAEREKPSPEHPPAPEEEVQEGDDSPA
jgi:hypothetical protein